jgi:hypothetical protein
MEEARRQFEVNVFGAARLMQLALPHMREQHSGRIINITSMGGRIYTPLGSWYHATKFALEALSDCVRLEAAPFGVDVAIIEPGGIRTEWGGIAAQMLRETSGTAPTQTRPKQRPAAWPAGATPASPPTLPSSPGDQQGSLREATKNPLRRRLRGEAAHRPPRRAARPHLRCADQTGQRNQALGGDDADRSLRRVHAHAAVLDGMEFLCRERCVIPPAVGTARAGASRRVRSAVNAEVRARRDVRVAVGRASAAHEGSPAMIGLHEFNRGRSGGSARRGSPRTRDPG